MITVDLVMITFFFFILSVLTYISYILAPALHFRMRHYHFLHHKKSKIRKKVQVRRDTAFFQKYKDRIEHHIKAASIPIKAEEVLLILFWGNVLVFLVNLLLFNLFIAILLLIFLNIGMMLLIKVLKNRRKMKMAEQLPEVLELISNSLKSGYSVNQTFELVSKENFVPISDEFALLVRAINYGTSMEEALNDLSKRVEIEEIKIFVDTILITKETGGNLTLVIDQLFLMLREKKAVKQEIKALTAQGRISGMIVGSMPFVLFVIFWFINPEYINVLFTNIIGNVFIGLAIIMQVIGIIFMRKIIQIKGR